jgi:hypothetical protein
MLLALMRARFRALLVAVALSVAAPRIATGLRRFGEHRRRRGGNSLVWRVPLGAAQALEYAAGQRRTRRRRFGRRR